MGYIPSVKRELLDHAKDVVREEIHHNFASTVSVDDLIQKIIDHPDLLDKISALIPDPIQPPPPPRSLTKEDVQILIDKTFASRMPKPLEFEGDEQVEVNTKGHKVKLSSSKLQKHLEKGHISIITDEHLSGGGKVKLGDQIRISFNKDTLIPLIQSTSSSTSKFIPLLSFGEGPQSFTYIKQKGIYTLIGNMVSFSLEIQVADKNESNGDAIVSGLPFYPIFGFASIKSEGLTIPNHVIDADFFSGNIHIRQKIYGGKYKPLTDANFTNFSSIHIFGIYWINIGDPK